MNFIKYIGFKNIFLALVEKEKQFYAFAMKTDKIKLDAEQKTETAYGLYFTPVGQFTTEIKCNVIIPAQVENKDNTLFHLIALDNEKEYDKLVSMLEVIL